MGTIQTSVGLISGIDYKAIVDQLISIESKPKALVQKRNTVLQAQQAAYQAVNAQLMNVLSSASVLADSRQFSQTAATSSNPAALTVTGSSSAIPGNYTFVVNQLVSAQQSISRGFADTDATAFAAGELRFAPAESGLTSRTLLADLNGGQGVSRGMIRITDGSGQTATVDLSVVVSVDDVIEKINAASGVNVLAEVDGNRLKITDLSGGTATELKISDVGSSGTASSLGLVGSAQGGELLGAAVHRLGAGTLLSSLNDGNGVRTARATQDDLNLTTAGGGSFNLSLEGLTTLGDLQQRVETATGGQVRLEMAADGSSLQLVDTTGAGGLTVTALNGSRAAEDLGLLGSDADDGQTDGVLRGGTVLAGINSKLLKNLGGGQGIGQAGSIEVTNRLGQSTVVDLSAARDISGVLKAINEAGAGVRATLNQAGNGLLLTDQSGGTGDLTIGDLGSGSIAADLGLAGTFSRASADSGNLNFRYISEATTLESLGVNRGKFTITDSNGRSGTVDLTQGNEVRLQDVIDEINSRGLALTARINDRGNGLLLEDTGTGVSAITVTEAGSSTAADLGLLGKAAEPGENFDGSFERVVKVEEGTTLTKLVQAINDAGVGVSASIIHDGSAGSPYRLSLASRTAGSGGAFLLDDGGLNLGLATLNQARDAEVFYGSSDPAKALLVTSKSNTLRNIIPGATVDLLATSSQPVQVTISEDTSAITSAIAAFVESFNGMVQSLDSYTRYNAETEEKGLLLGSSTVSRVKQSVFNAVIGVNGTLPGQFTSLSQVGVRVGPGSVLQFDESKFMDAWQADPQAVRQLFTFEQYQEDEAGEPTKNLIAQGIGKELKDLLTQMTDRIDGTVQRQVSTIQSQIDQNNKRISAMDISLAAKRARLEAQFIAMESALAQMQDQGSAIGQIQAISMPVSNKK